MEFREMHKCCHHRMARGDRITWQVACAWIVAHIRDAPHATLPSRGGGAPRCNRSMPWQATRACDIEPGGAFDARRRRGGCPREGGPGWRASASTVGHCRRCGRLRRVLVVLGGAELSRCGGAPSERARAERHLLSSPHLRRHLRVHHRASAGASPCIPVCFCEGISESVRSKSWRRPFAFVDVGPQEDRRS